MFFSFLFVFGSKRLERMRIYKSVIGEENKDKKEGREDEKRRTRRGFYKLKEIGKYV